MPEEAKEKSFLPLIIIIVVLLLLVFITAGYFYFLANKDKESTVKVTTSTTSASKAETKTQITKIGSAKQVFTGGYADPSIIKKADGTYLMYLNSFGKSANGYSVYTSTDAETWSPKTGVIFTGISVARAFQIDSGIRFYYPEQMPLVESNSPMPNLLSAFSTDGLKFTNDPGKRLVPRDRHFMGGLTVFHLKTGALRMYFEEPESSDPTKRISAIWGASSSDGLTWTRDSEPTIEDHPDTSNVSTGWAQALHPYVVTKTDGSFLMFYNTHSEILAADSKDGLTWTKLGKIGVHGADCDGVWLPNGNFRLYYGDFSPKTSGEVFFIDLQIT